MPISHLSIILSLIYFNISLAKEAPELKDVKKWAQKIDNDLQYLGHLYPILKQKFVKDDGPGIKRIYSEVSGQDLVTEMAKSLSVMMHKKMEALRKLVDVAENTAAAYKWNKNLVKNMVTYVNTKEVDNLRSSVVYVDRFRKEVNFNISCVHIPVEIYDGDIDILNGLNWTASLEEQFKENFNNDPDILWQYFGSHTGFMRTFPTAAWPTTRVDLYDVRRQSWYTQGSSSPKDMMILIDTSGSTHGQSLQLMQNAVKSILDTLGENDFVNIISFAEEATFVSKCFNKSGFVQANFRNKKQMVKDVDKISATGQADFSKAIKFVFEQFKEFERNNSNDDKNIGADCNKVIMLLTDGGTDNAEHVFEKYNWPNKTVRVFTYAVGPTPNPIHAIRWMACANRGYFSQIPAMGAIRARVQGYTEYLSKMMELLNGQSVSWEGTFDPREYIPVLSRPQVIKNKKIFEWGNIYEDYMGLGMMTTVTLPVYNRSLGSSNQTILGVMGIDVTTAKLEAMTPFSKIGPNGYSFAINPNGYVVFHPNLQTMGKFMKEPPNIDMLELEIDENNPMLMDLRSDMIDGRTGSKVVKTLFLSNDQRYVTFDEANYSYTQIENTTFRLALCIPTSQKKYPQFSLQGPVSDLKSLNWSNAHSLSFKVFIAPWNYHKNMSQQKNLSGTIEDIEHMLSKDSNPDNWNMDLLKHLYWDVSTITEDIVYFIQKINNSTEDAFVDWDNLTLSKEERVVFVMTNGGMTLISPASASNSSYFEKNHDPRKSSLYQRAQHSSNCIFMADYIEGPRSNTSETPYISMACAVSLTQLPDKPETVFDKPAVIGEWITHDEIMAVLRNKTFSDSLYHCDEPKYLSCYLIDDGGFLVATNTETYREDIGRFFGEVDPPIFSKLNGTMFTRAVQYDFQAACKQVDDTMSAGFKGFTIPTFNMMFDLLNVGWWTSKVSWAYTSFNLYSWLFSPTVEVYADEEEDDERACVKGIEQYYIIPNNDSYVGSIECQNYTRNFTAVKLDRSNLLFIVTEPIGETSVCHDLYKPITQSPKEISAAEEETVICEMAKNSRKRARVYTCYHQDPRVS
ncbi:unnamed protein product [Lymnaea stagnalis]|uniref:VWFA domain-containing protein n=1 Tax=Lymnaea stagnalis TaxID=6523 RepID=A0AAV2I519_LYMST